MVAVELLDDGAAPREPGDVRRAERELVDHGGETVGVVRQAEVRGHIR